MNGAEMSRQPQISFAIAALAVLMLAALFGLDVFTDTKHAGEFRGCVDVRIALVGGRTFGGATFVTDRRRQLTVARRRRNVRRICFAETNKEHDGYHKDRGGADRRSPANELAMLLPRWGVAIKITVPT